MAKKKSKTKVTVMDEDLIDFESVLPNQPLGTDTKVLKNPNHKEVVKEKGMETLVNMMKNLGTDADVPPMIISKQKGQLIILALEKKDGQYVIPEFKAMTEEEIKAKEKVARKIVKKMDTVIKRDIESVVYTALIRKPKKQLDRILAKFKGKKEKARLVNRVGCIFLEIEEESIQI